MDLTARGRVLPLTTTAIMGILNVTPDSFSDGGLWLDPQAAVDHALEMAGEGAAIIDVGGESTRPGAQPVSEQEELERVLPVIGPIASSLPGTLISIDTRKPNVARAAVEAGAAIINDTSGEQENTDMDAVAAETGAAVIVMHSRGTPETMRSLTSYRDVVSDVGGFLLRRAEQLQEAGVARSSICLDPGFGFAKTPEQNVVLLGRIEELVGLGYPVLCGTSRKSFIGALLGGLAEEDRLEGTLATLVWAISRGVRLVRVHDVRPVERAVRMTEAILRLEASEGAAS